MSRRDAYHTQLRACTDWDALLQQQSGLPGPRGNLELAHAAALAGDEARFTAWVRLSPEAAPENTPGVFLVFCGALGLGRLLAEGRREVLPTLRSLARDPRWRVREGVATGLQTWGDTDMDALLAEMAAWSGSSPYEQRAAVAALCEPRLLREPAHAAAVLALLDQVTATLVGSPRPLGDDRAALRKALGYGWSVAVAALPEPGKAALARWAQSDDRDVRWVVRENLKKDRLRRADAAWVAGLAARVA
jgi:hypothetical protein